MEEPHDKDLDDVMEEIGFGASEPSDPKEGIGSEAANSVNIRVYIDGFGVQFTHRRNTAMGVVKIARLMIKTAKENGWKTSWKEDGSVEPISSGPPFGRNIYTPPSTVGGLTKECLTHGVSMEEKYSKAKGKKYFVHYNEEGKPCFGKGYMA